MSIITATKLRFPLVFILLCTSTFVHAEKIWFDKTETPLWNGSIYTTYHVKLDSRVHGIMGVYDGSFTNNGKTISYGAGGIVFNIFDIKDRKRIRDSRFELSPQVFPVNTKIWIDGELFIEELYPDINVAQMLIEFPYAIKQVDIETKFNTGKSYRMAIKIDKIPYLKAGYDMRQKTGTSRGDWDTWNIKNSMIIGTGPGLIVNHCVSSRKAGYIKSMESTLQKHPIFSPDGDRSLGKILVHIPVYQVHVQRFWRLPMEVPPDKRYEDHYLKVSGVCETVTGKKFTTTRDIKIPRQPLPSGAGTAIETYITQ